MKHLKQKFKNGDLRISTFLSLVLMIFIFSSCLDDNEYEEPYKVHGNNTEAIEMAKLKTFIKDQNITQAPESNGLYVIKNKITEGEAVKSGDTLLVGFTGKFLDGTNWISTNRFFKKLDSLPVPVVMILKSSSYITGFYDGLLKMKVGEEARLIMPSKLAYGSYQNGYHISKYTSLQYDVKIHAKGEKAFKTYEEDVIKVDIAKGKLNFLTSGTGLHYSVITPGTLKNGATVYKIKYTLTYLNGLKVYMDGDRDADGVYEFYISRIQSKGISETLKLIGKGGKIVSYIPSYLLEGRHYLYAPVKFECEITSLR